LKFCFSTTPGGVLKRRDSVKVKWSLDGWELREKRETVFRVLSKKEEMFG